jgi:hypothetical protein
MGGDQVGGLAYGDGTALPAQPNKSATSVVMHFRIFGAGISAAPRRRVIQHHVGARSAGRLEDGIRAESQLHTDAVGSLQAVKYRGAGFLRRRKNAARGSHPAQMFDRNIGADQDRPLLLHQLKDIVRELKSMFDGINAGRDCIPGRGVVLDALAGKRPQFMVNPEIWESRRK